jgi:hypothetical protein
MRAIIFAGAVGAVLLGQVGCTLTDVDLGDSATRQMLSLLMPAEIIVEPFTGLKSFDDDDLPDGIEVVMRPVDAFGDPVKIAGHLIIEVHQFRPASGERQGRKIEQWDIELASTRDQQKYWNRVTQMYEIPLALGPEAMALGAGEKFVIGITYNTPLGEHMITEHVFEPPLQTETGLAGQ